MPDLTRAADQEPQSGSATDTEMMLAAHPLIIASNRGPVTFTRRSDGSFDGRKGSGGVVTAVSADRARAPADLDRRGDDRRRPPARRSRSGRRRTAH